MLRRADRPLHLAELQREREVLVRHVLSQPGAVAEGVDVDLLQLARLDVASVLEALAGGAPLGGDELAQLRAGALVVQPAGYASAIATSGLSQPDLDLAAYEAFLLQGGDTADHVAHELRRAAGLPTRRAAMLRLIIEQAGVAGLDLNESTPAPTSAGYRLHLCHPSVLTCAMRTIEETGEASAEGGQLYAELLRWVARQLALVGLSVTKFLEEARGGMLITPRAADGDALSPTECWDALDELQEMSQNWLREAVGEDGGAAVQSLSAGPRPESLRKGAGHFRVGQAIQVNSESAGGWIGGSVTAVKVGHCELSAL